jgi:glycosyltransferase involved in cell wall biosynthesis
LGRIVQSKGIYVIADALHFLNNHYRDFEFHIYGSGPELDILLDRLKNVEGLNYQYHGIVRGDEKWIALENAHLFLLPSLFGEGLPIAMLEAMGKACVPVVSDDASITSVVKHNDNGCIVRKGDSRDLANVIRRFLNNRELLPHLSVNAQNTIRESYGIDSYMANLNTFFARI